MTDSIAAKSLDATPPKANEERTKMPKCVAVGESLHSEVAPILLLVSELKVHFPCGNAGLFKTPWVVRTVDGVSFDIKRGRPLVLVDESDSGKTTMALAMMCLMPVTNGHICLGETNIPELEGETLHKERSRFQVIFHYSYSSLDPHQRAGVVVRAPLAGMYRGQIVERAPLREVEPGHCVRCRRIDVVSGRPRPILSLLAV